MSLGWGVVATVLFGALLHASWNALVKSGSDQTLDTALVHTAMSLIAVPLALFAMGNIFGTIAGGQLADRLRDRLLTFAVAMALSGIAALALFMWHPGPVVSIAVGFVYVLLNALGRPSYMAALASVPEEMRGTVLGLNGTSASVGWMGAAALGAATIGYFGFEGFGPLAAVLAVLAALGALLCRRTAIP